MEQLMNTLLAGVQTPQIPQVAKKGEPAEKDDFQKLLEQKQNTQEAPKQEKPETVEKDAQPVQDGKEPQEAEAETQPVVKSGKELEDQMALAAMAMMQNPVVPVEQVTAPEAQAAVVEAAPVAVELAVDPEGSVLTPETEETVVPQEAENVVENTLQAPDAETPETIEAPEAAQAAEDRTVEVEVKVVETGRPQETETAAPEKVADTAERPAEEDTPELQDAEMAETPVFEDVKAVPVKVGEAPKAEAAPETAKAPEEQIAPKLTEALANGDTRVELQLTPENLGKVTVEMTFGKDGGLVVQLHAENRETQNLLSKSTNHLAELLGRETQQEVRVEVPRQEESQRQDLYDQQQKHHQQQQQQREQHRRQAASGEDFMQQLRLGLIPLDEE